MVDITKNFIREIIEKSLEYQDLNNQLTIWITSTVALLFFIGSLIVIFWGEWILIIILILVLIFVEIILISLISWYNKTKKEIVEDINKIK